MPSLTYVSRDCVECGLPFSGPPNRLRRVSRCDSCIARHRATERQCSTCGATFRAAPSLNHARCPACIDNGRGRCVACGGLAEVGKGVQGATLCAGCVAGETADAALVPGYIKLRCRGVTAFGSTRHAKNCQPLRIVPEGRAVARFTSYDPATRTFICDRCHGLTILAKGIETRQTKARKAAGRGLHGRINAGITLDRPRSWKSAFELIAEQAQQHPNWRDEPPDDARRRQPKLTSEAIWQRTLAQGALGPEGRTIVDVCRGCGKLTLNSAASKGAGPLGYHAPCWRRALQTDAGRKWSSRRLIMARQHGLTKAEIDTRVGQVPPGAFHPASDPATITRYFEWTSWTILAGKSQGDIAKEAGVSRAAVSSGVRTVLELLPEPELCNKRLRRYVDAFRAAISHREVTG